MLNFEDICKKAIPITQEVGQFIANAVGQVTEQAIEEKAVNSLVSYVDRTAEEQLVIQLGQLLPEATFLTEEETVEQSESDLRWIIDPLDGTTNFLHQLPVFSVSVALQYQGEIVVGIVHEVNRQETFYAWKGGGAFLNSQPIRVSTRTTLSECLLATGFPYYDYDRTQAYLAVLEYFMKNTRGIRRLGSAAVDMAYVAAGRFDGFYEYSLNAWDIAAGVLLVQEAGGMVTDFSGSDNYLFGQEMLAASPQIHDDMLRTIDTHFKAKK